MAEDKKQTVILEFEVDVDNSVDSINKLTAANKELRKERNELNIASKEGQKRAQEINAQIDKNTDKIKANVSAIEKQKINIGNYRSALDGVHPALGKLGAGLEGGTAGFKAMTLQALAFIATPIGAIIAALVVAFKALQTFVQNSAVGMDKFEDVTAAVGAVVEIVVDRITKFVGALGKLLSGDFSGGLEDMQNSFKGIGDEIEREVAMAVALAGAIRDLEDREIDYSIAVGETENAIKRLILQSKNRSLTEAERIKKLEEAAAIEMKQNEENLAIEEERLRIANETANQKIELARIQGETEIEFGKRIVQAFKEGKAQADDLRDAVVDGIKRRQSAESESFNLLEKIENQKAGLQERAAAQREKELKDKEKEIELIKKQAEEEFKLSEAERTRRIEKLQDSEKPVEEDFATQFKVRTDFNQKLNDTIAAQNEAARNKEIEDAQKTAAITEQIEQQKFAAALAVSDGILGLLDSQSEEYKAIATAQTLVSTYAAAAKAYEAAFLPIPTVASPAIGTAFAAAAVLQGLARVAEINGVEFAEGGWTGPGSKYQVAGVVHADEYVTPKHVVNNPAARPHINALESMRLRPYYDGGMVTRAISQPINSNFDVLNIVKNMPPSVVSVKEINAGQRAVKVKQNISKR
jgi:hypothetical protein